MVKQVKKKRESHARESEPPAEDLVENNLKGRCLSTRKYDTRNDDGGPNPKGRSSTDKVSLKS